MHTNDFLMLNEIYSLCIASKCIASKCKTKLSSSNKTVIYLLSVKYAVDMEREKSLLTSAITINNDCFGPYHSKFYS